MVLRECKNVFVSFYDGDPVEIGDKIESRDNNLTMVLINGSQTYRQANFNNLKQ